MFITKICAKCGKSFIPASGHLYKLQKHGKLEYYCSYKCWRKAGGDNGKFYFR